MSPLPAALRPAHLLVLATFLRGAATVINKALLGPVAPLTLLSIQLAPGFLLALSLALALRVPFPRRRDLGLALLLGVLNPGLSYSLGMLGLARIPASFAALLWATEPLMILPLGALALREPVTRPVLAVVLLGLGGVWIIAGPGVSGPDPVGLALVPGAVALCAVYTVFSRGPACRSDPLALLSVQHGAGLAWALALLATQSATESGAGAATLVVGVATGFLYYGLSYWLYLLALREVPASVAGACFNLIPFFALLLAALFLGESLTPRQWLGAALILGAAVVLVRLTGPGSGGSAGR